MPHSTSESGRTRLVITVVLAMLIGAVGAFLLPVLVHEAKPPAPTTFRAEIGFVVPAGGLPEASMFRVTATHPNLASLSVQDAIPEGANQAAVVGLLAQEIESAGWSGDRAPQVAGSTLSFPAVKSIGGDPGGAGTPMSLSVSGRLGQALSLRIVLTGGRGGESDDARARVALSARGVIGGDEADADPASASETTDWTRPADALKALGEKLHRAGWLMATNDDGDLHIQALPDAGEIGSAILTVEYEGAPDPPCAWTIELLP